jgi:hypothetical protein
MSNQIRKTPSQRHTRGNPDQAVRRQIPLHGTGSGDPGRSLHLRCDRHMERRSVSLEGGRWEGGGDLENPFSCISGLYVFPGSPINVKRFAVSAPKP